MIRFALSVPLALAVLAQDNPFAGDPKAAATGKGMFRIYCAPCHGIKAEGGRGPDLSRGVFRVGERDADLYRIIENGSAAAEMPGYKGPLGDEGIWRVIVYLRSITQKQSETVAGGAASGEKLFWGKHACGNCHRVGNRGQNLGPDLTIIGRTRNLKHLRDALVDPDADVASGYATIEAVTRDGRKLSGVQRGYDNFSARFVDLQGNYHSYLKEDVRSLERKVKSLMPSYKAAPARELDDLIAYMYSLQKGTPE